MAVSLVLSATACGDNLSQSPTPQPAVAATATSQGLAGAMVARSSNFRVVATVSTDSNAGSSENFSTVSGPEQGGAQ